MARHHSQELMQLEASLEAKVRCLQCPSRFLGVLILLPRTPLLSLVTQLDASPVALTPSTSVDTQPGNRVN